MSTIETVRSRSGSDRKKELLKSTDGGFEVGISQVISQCSKR